MTCESCKGDGRGIENGLWVKCGTCNGSGQQPVDPELIPVDPELLLEPHNSEIYPADPSLDGSIVRKK